MIPQYCPQCKSSNIVQRFSYLMNENINRCTSCRLEFVMYEFVDTIRIESQQRELDALHHPKMGSRQSQMAHNPLDTKLR